MKKNNMIAKINNITCTFKEVNFKLDFAVGPPKIYNLFLNRS